MGTLILDVDGTTYALHDGKLKRLVATGLVAEHTPGLFAIPRPRAGT